MVFEHILQEIEKRKVEDRPFVLGISGIERSGKTMFTQEVAGFFEDKKNKIQIIHLDDFLNPREIRYAGEDLSKTYFDQGYDIETLVEKLLVPIHQKSSFTVTLPVLNYETDKYDREKEYVFDQNTIVIIEGVFLYRKELASYIDYKIFLDISFEESKKRAETRDVPVHGEEIINTSHVRYWPAQKRYLEQYPPSKMADLIIDYTDWDNPKMKSVL